jgi:hypothetical protein
MQTIKGRRAFALSMMFIFAASAARADLITPDSIPNPPAAVASADGTPVPSGSLVTTQYTGLGLNFTDAAITRLNGATVWVPVDPQAMPASSAVGWPPGPFPPPQISYGPWIPGGNFVVPGTTKPTSVYSMTLEIVGRSVVVDAWGLHGVAVGAVGPNGIGPHGGSLYTLSGGNISAFDVFVPVMDPPDTNYPAWGIASVSFTNHPEPSSLVLAGLGALGLAARFGRRWNRSAIA